MNKNYAFIGLCLGLSMAFQVHAQKPVAAPMKDVNQVIDNTLDSLNKARTARPVPGSSRKGNNPVLFWLGTARCVQAPWVTAITDNGDGDILLMSILMRTV